LVRMITGKRIYKKWRMENIINVLQQKEIEERN
jgi:hypothetical protein